MEKEEPHEDFEKLEKWKRDIENYIIKKYTEDSTEEKFKVKIKLLKKNLD